MQNVAQAGANASAFEITVSQFRRTGKERRVDREVLRGEERVGIPLPEALIVRRKNSEPEKCGRGVRAGGGNHAIEDNLSGNEVEAWTDEGIVLQHRFDFIIVCQGIAGRIAAAIGVVALLVNLDVAIKANCLFLDAAKRP